MRSLSDGREWGVSEPWLLFFIFDVNYSFRQKPKRASAGSHSVSLAA
jgi:hypothetical protein